MQRAGGKPVCPPSFAPQQHAASGFCRSWLKRRESARRQRGVTPTLNTSPCGMAEWPQRCAGGEVVELLRDLQLGGLSDTERRVAAVDAHYNMHGSNPMQQTAGAPLSHAVT